MHYISFRYGLVVRIAGSHPAGPGSIPGNGNLFLSSVLNYFFAEWLKVGSNCILNKSNIFEDFLTKMVKGGFKLHFKQVKHF